MGESKELPTRPMRMLGFVIIIVIFIIIWLFLWFVLYQIFFLYINLVLIKKNPFAEKVKLLRAGEKDLSVSLLFVCF